MVHNLYLTSIGILHRFFGWQISSAALCTDLSTLHKGVLFWFESQLYLILEVLILYILYILSQHRYQNISISRCHLHLRTKSSETKLILNIVSTLKTETPFSSENRNNLFGVRSQLQGHSSSFFLYPWSPMPYCFSMWLLTHSKNMISTKAPWLIMVHH